MSEQLSTGRRILNLAEQLHNAISALQNDPQIVEQLGVLEKLVKDNVSIQIPTRFVEIAQKLADLKIDEFGDWGIKSTLWTPNWVIEHVKPISST